MYLLTQPKNGTSIPELKRQPGIGYNAAWRLKHKLRQVMKDHDALHQVEGIRKEEIAHSLPRYLAEICYRLTAGSSSKR